MSYRTYAEKLFTYRALFRGRMPEADLQSIRDATNKAWVLGSDRFKQQFSKETGTQSQPQQRGGDRKSKYYKELKNQ